MTKPNIGCHNIHKLLFCQAGEILGTNFGASINHVDCWGGRELALSKMTILLHKPYFVKVSTKGVKNLTTWFMDTPFLHDKWLDKFPYTPYCTCMVNSEEKKLNSSFNAAKFAYGQIHRLHRHDSHPPSGWV